MSSFFKTLAADFFELTLNLKYIYIYILTLQTNSYMSLNDCI